MVKEASSGFGPGYGTATDDGLQWAAIFHERNVRLVAGLEDLRFYNSELDRPQRVLPCKVSCGRCGALIADEGRRMWLAFPTLFDFGTPPQVPDAFRPSCHIFYGARVIDIDDGLPKWSGHKNESTLLSSVARWLRTHVSESVPVKTC